ncbi:MAG TPA: Smr/MutS family protein [Arenimonas sp.]|nr:Smr/MutS family protein [Arenimonas sp.]
MAGRKPPRISPEDASLFREAIGEVRPLPAAEEAPAPPRPKPRARMRARDEAEALAQSRDPLRFAGAIEAAEALVWRRDGVPDKVLRQLRKGGYRIGAEFDLHELRAEEAGRHLRAFLAEARAEGIACVRIIHGKGLRSAGGSSVLKALVDRMLRQRADVLAYASAPEAMGGTGAVLVLLAGGRRGA